MQNFFHIEFEVFLLFFVCYLAFLYLCIKFLNLRLNIIDFMYISVFFLIIFLKCLFEDTSVLATDVSVPSLFNDFIIYSNLIRLLKICMVLFFFIYLALVYNFDYIIKIPILEYLILIFLCFFSLVMIIISNHLFVIFLFLEIVNICLYCLIGLNKESNKGIEAAYKYFIQSAFATIIGFFAISLIYIFTGTLFLSELLLLLYENDFIVKLSFFFLITIVFFKLGLFPLHSWVPDVYQGSYLIVALFIATLPKFAYIFLFLKIFLLSPSLFISYSSYIGLFSILYGSIITLYQTSFKRLIAYGSIVHMGFIIYSISLYSVVSITAAFFYLIVYIALTLFVFTFMFFLFEEGENENGNGIKIFFLDDISSIGQFLNSNYLLSFYFSYIILSLAGLPFFMGFISKWYIFSSLLMKNQFIDLFVIIGASVLSSVYYIRLLRFLFFIESKDKKVKSRSMVKLNKSIYFLITFLFIFNILIIFYHNWIFLYILKCVLSLFP